MLMMTMLNGDTTRSNPTVQVPPWDHLLDDPTPTMTSPFSGSPNGDAAGYSSSSPFDALTALHRYLPSNNSDYDDCDVTANNAFSHDHFRMYEFKVRKCARGRSHDWTECPYAHPGEKARRRDPRKFHYSGTACPDFRKGHCLKGDACEYAHGVFECWLHPARYRTQPCKDGTQCRRRVCFFAHTPDQLRVLPQTSPVLSESYDGSPSRLGFDSYLSKGSFVSSPTSILYSPPGSPPSDSPPQSPNGVNSLTELALSVRKMQIGKVRPMGMSPPGWGMQMGSGFCSPRGGGSGFRPGFLSLPSTPTRGPTRCSGLGVFDLCEDEEEPVMERVESGKNLRAKMYAKLSKENSLERVESEGNSVAASPDLGWISELVK